MLTFQRHFYYKPDIVFQVFAFKVFLNDSTTPSYLSLDSVSLNGTDVPQIYVHSDVLGCNSGNTTSTISAVTRINGVDTQTALNNLSATLNMQDPDASYNSLLYNQAMSTIHGAAQNPWGVFADGVHYFGNQTVLEFANGTQKTYQNMAGALQPFSGIQSGEDLFKRFCTGQTAASTDTNSTTPAPATGLAAAVNYPSQVAQDGTGAVNGYLLTENNLDVAVLELSSFSDDTDTAALLAFSGAVAQFLRSAAQAGKQKLIIDLRGNGGGSVELAYDTFKQLFPTMEPYGAVRAHAHEAYNLLGSLASAVSPYAPGVNALSPAANPLVNYQLNVDVNNQNFESWTDFYGPDTIHGDNFTSLFRQNLTNTLSTNLFPVAGYSNSSSLTPQHFTAENMVMLTDGICGSTCAVFAEFMKTQGNVTSIAIGGRPHTGPMQAVGATKGARLISFQTIYLAVVSFAATMSTQDLLKLASGPLGAIFNATQPILRTGGGLNAAVNGLNNYRMNDTTQTPLQFVNEAADCRLFYTPAMIQNISNVWSAVAQVQWGGSNSTVKCVANSTSGQNSLSSGNITIAGTPINNATVFDPSGSGSGSPGQSSGKTNAASGFSVPALTACVMAAVAAFLL